MAFLVQAQGEQLENIDLILNKAKNYMEKGVKELDKAKKSHIAGRKVRLCDYSANFVSQKMCCGLIILLLVAVVLIIVGTKFL